MLAGYSPYLLAQLQFPYVEGLRFTCQRWLDGGWDAVNAGFTDPPLSGDTALGLSLIDRGEGPPLCETVRQWYVAAFPDSHPEPGGGVTSFDGPAQDAALACPGDQVRLGIALTVAEALSLSS